MRLSRRKLLAASGLGISIAGCLGSDGTDGDDDPGDDDGAEGNPTVAVDSHPDYGDILVDAEGMTLYNFDNDTQGEGASTCYDDCEANWPPLTVDGDPVAGDGVTAELTTFERDDGSVQVAADGWPLYYFTPDEEPGDSMGQGVNDVWWVLEPDGTLIREVADEEEEEEDDADMTVVLSDFQFDPEVVEIEVGQTVAFDWDADHHNIVITEQPADSSWDGVTDLQMSGYRHTHTFEVAGEYEFMCEPHVGVGMVGTIIVNENGSGSKGGGFGYDY